MSFSLHPLYLLLILSFNPNPSPHAVYLSPLSPHLVIFGSVTTVLCGSSSSGSGGGAGGGVTTRSLHQDAREKATSDGVTCYIVWHTLGKCVPVQFVLMFYLDEVVDNLYGIVGRQ